MQPNTANNMLYVSYCAFAAKAMDVRVHQPVDAMRMLGANVGLFDTKVTLLNDVPEGAAKILVLQRAILDKKTWPLVIKACIAKDWVVVVEYDDYPENPANAKLRAKSLDWKRFEMCHGVQCSTKPLADVFTKYNDEVAIFENQLYRLPPPLNKDPENVRVFFGSLNRKTAWEPLVDTYNQVIADHPEIQPIVLYDKEFFNALKSPKKTFKPLLKYHEYLNAITSCDIVLTPLDDTSFNRYKSDVKFLEAAAGGAAVIASPTIYKDTIIHEKTGLIANTPQEWGSSFRRLVSDKKLRETLSQNAKEYVVENRMLLQHIHKRFEWYQHLWDTRQTINERLLSDFPELKS